MPKDKIQGQNNRNTNQANALKQKRSERKDAKEKEYEAWEKIELQQIEADVDQLQEQENKALEAAFQQIDNAAELQLQQKKNDLITEWRDIKVTAKFDLDRLDTKFAAQMEEAFKKLDKEYQDKEADAEREHREAVVNIKADKEKLQKELASQKEKLDAEIAKYRKEVEKSLEEIRQISDAISKFNAKGAASKEAQLDMDRKIKQQVSVLGAANKKSRELDAEIKKLEKQKEDLVDKKLEPYEKQIQEADRKYEKKLNELFDEKTKKQAEEKAKAQIEKDKESREYKQKTEWEFNPVKWSLTQENVRKDVEAQKSKLKEQSKSKVEAEKAKRVARLQKEGGQLQKRLNDSVDFGIEVEKLEISAKSYGGSNTREFNDLVDALKKAEKAAGTVKVSQEEIQSSCLKAYKECRNYMQKKERGWSFLERFRSRTGKDRIRMAQDMMDKLKTFYPGLEEALKTGNVLQGDAQDEKILQEPQRKAPAKDTGKIKRELDEAKKELRKKNGMQNENAGFRIKKKTALQTKQQVKQPAK